MYDGKHVVPLLLSIPLDSDHSLMMTIAQVVETSVATEDAHPFDQTSRSNATPGFKPCTV